LAQGFCEGNFDCDLDVDGSDAFVFKTDFGRSAIVNPCPTIGNCCSGTLSPLGRWCDQNDGTVLDMTNGLVWLKDASCMGQMDWFNAIEDPITNLQNGDCSGTLTDNSVWGEWRLPGRDELASLNHYFEAITATDTYFFSGVQNVFYWSSATVTENATYAWKVNPMAAGTTIDLKTSATSYVWPVRVQEGRFW
jgi:hypothetical protein